MIWLAIVWLIVFGGVFFSLQLPNASPAIARWELGELVPHILYDCVVHNPDPNAIRLSWSHLPQRFPIIVTGVFIILGAWALGHLLLRAMRLQLDPWSHERNVLATGLGLSAVSLLTLICGLLGLLSRSLLGGMLAVFLIAECVLLLRSRGPSDQKTTSRNSAPPWHQILLRGQIPFPILARIGLGFVIGLFVIALALGAMLPSIDFDVKEYHLQGPKEWYQAGAIMMLPHNVYTSFPFLTEMFPLLGMVLCDDWQQGALVGKFVLMLFGPLTALGLFALARRWFDDRVAWAAALIHMSTPWTYRVSVIAYAEGGLTFYLFASLLAVLLVIDCDEPRERLRRTLLAGLLAGSAMACKYPGVLSVVIPLGAVLLWQTRRNNVGEGETAAEPHIPDGAGSAGTSPSRINRLLVHTALAFSLGCAITVGPWLLKNLVETGNPVYPLLNSVFDGIDWTPTLETNWKRAHSPPHHDPSDLAVKFFDVTFKSDWLSPLLFSLAPLAFFVDRQKRLIRGLWLYVGFLFFSWWLLTHRIDRFWVPLIPVVSLLAGVGIWWTTHRMWRYAAGAAVTASVLFNMAFIATPYCGLNTWLADYKDVDDIAQSTAATIQTLNRMKHPPGTKVLCVGEAQVFDARFPVVYNTVFDISIFEQWCSANEPGIEPVDQPLKPAEDIRQKLIDEGVTHVLVNWSEILRYRMTYKYAEFVAPRRFVELTEKRILTFGPAPTRERPLHSYRPEEQEELKKWAPELMTTVGGETYVQTSQLFFVTSTLPDHGQVAP